MIIIYIAIVLSIYVGLWLWRTYRPFNKNRYFKKQLNDLDYQIADTEFKRFKSKEAKEELRHELTVMKSKSEALVLQIKNEKKLGKLTIDDIKRMEDDLVKLDLLIKRTENGREEGDTGDYVMNLKDFDTAVITYNSQVDQLRSLKELLKEYISKELK